jgi:multidrug efflux pump
LFSRFFIDRPIFAAVLSILITLAGGIAVFTLPIAQYPQITPPTIQVDCVYPGASSQVVAESIAAPIEQEVNGVEDMLYMVSQCTNDGSYTLTVTFKNGVNLNMAQVLVQNRLNLALPRLPDVVKATGVTTRKRSPDILLTVSLNSPTGRYDQLYMSNYAVLHLKDELSRLPGISDVLVFGQRDYSMRIWVDPEKMATRNLTASDLVNAVRDENSQVATGQVGQPPTGHLQAIQIPLSTSGRLIEPEQFENIVVKADHDGRKVRLKDVARVEMGAKSQDVSNQFDRKATIGLAIFQLSDANALDTADLVKDKMKELSNEFPEGIIYEIGYDTTPFISESIAEVFKSLRDAILLVALVVLVFLQNWRSAVIPLIAVPVAIVGTFAAMAAVGFSLNNLTLFGLVLAIGIVVDDAIVVVEAVENHIEQGMMPRDATIRAMEEVSGPVVAVGLVLSFVFIPCAFMTGIVGQFYRQFALTIAISTIISAFNSLTLSPALAAILLQPKDAKKDIPSRLLNLVFGWFFWLFNNGFRLATFGYVRTVGVSLRAIPVVLIVYIGLLALTIWEFLNLPTGFIPTQDKGYVLASIQMPDATSVEKTRAAIRKIEKIALETPGVRHCNSVAGNSFLLSAYGSNFGSMFIILDGFDKRRDADLYSDAIIARLKERLATEVPEAEVNMFNAPAVSGLGRAGGFKFMVEDRGEVGLRTLQGQTDNMVEKAKQQPGLTGVFSVFRANSPQLYADVNRAECLTQGVELNDVFDTMRVYLGSRYVNDFNRFGRTWQVVIQADARFRNDLDDVKRLKVRNNKGAMVPLGALATVKEVTGPLVLTRYNMYPAAAIQGSAASGVSTGDSIAIMQQLAEQELPKSMSYEWTEITYLEKQSSNTGIIVFGLSVVFVFMVLAALYESWTLPLAVILVVPMCVLSSLGGILLARSDLNVWPQIGTAKMDINIFTQIGFVVLIGLACKNAILIVEFAKFRRDEGIPRRQAILQACQLRLRPIMMTSFAFILGVAPLVYAKGAGAEMRYTLGTAVFAGMLGVTLFGIFLTPVFFSVVDRVSEASFFHTRTMRIIGTILLLTGVLGTFGLLGIALLLMGRKLRPPATVLPVETRQKGH